MQARHRTQALIVTFVTAAALMFLFLLVPADPHPACPDTSGLKCPSTSGLAVETGVPASSTSSSQPSAPLPPPTSHPSSTPPESTRTGTGPIENPEADVPSEDATAAESNPAASFTAPAANEPSFIPASSPQHFINFTYSAPGNFTTFEYAIKVDTNSNVDNIYYSQYFYGNDHNGFYSGLQPHPNGKAGVRFSYFGNGATPLDAHCRAGADGGSGVTCGANDLIYATGRTYIFRTIRSRDSQGFRYTGTITDSTTEVTRTIGAWRVPADVVGFSNAANAFIEKFSGVNNCGDTPSVAVSYSGVQADSQMIQFRSFSQKAAYRPGSGIYTCGNVSNYSITASQPGRYTVISSASR